MSNNQQSVKREERWKMPCGSEINTVAHGEQAVPDAVLLSRIISQADRALAKANDFKERFVQNTFYYTTFEKFHSSFKPEFFHLDWLQSREKIPKELGESVPKEHLATLKIEETLYNTYEHLQKVAIGFEQMIEDGQNGIGGRFIAEFNETLDYVLSILCEIQTAMVERNMELRSDVERDVMPNDLKGLDTTATNNRNWIIYRDYMNLLEYVIESFRYLKQKY